MRRFELEYPSPFDDEDVIGMIVAEQSYVRESQQIPCLGCGEHVLFEFFALANADLVGDHEDPILEVAGHQIQNVNTAPTLLCVGCRKRRAREIPT